MHTYFIYKSVKGLIRFIKIWHESFMRMKKYPASWNRVNKLCAKMKSRCVSNSALTSIDLNGLFFVRWGRLTWERPSSLMLVDLRRNSHGNGMYDLILVIEINQLDVKNSETLRQEQRRKNERENKWAVYAISIN